MQYATAEYREEMKEALRDPSYVWVYLGVINQLAQRSATVSAVTADFSDNTQAMDKPVFEAYYATYEQNQFKVDGSMFFLPEDGTYALYQGIVTDMPLTPVTFTFGIYQEIALKGLTIDFGDYYPTEFEVSNGTTTRTYAMDAPGKFTCEDIFSGCHFIQITPKSMVGGIQRFRILSILFGIGLQFDNTEIISTSRSNTVDHISSQLPSKMFTFTVDNTKLKLNKDNPNSFADYLEEKQECVFEYGRTLKDGTVERIPGGVTLLKSWSSTDLQAKFTTVGKLEYMSSTYYKGDYYADGITAYALAEEVLADAGITDYRLDEEMKNVTIYNPLPIDTHKACLQQIANTCRAIMYEDRDGYITIQTSILPQVKKTVGNYVETYSSDDYLITTTSVYNYATYEKDYMRVDGQQYFLSDGGYLPTGFISLPSNNSGTWTVNPYVDITFATKAIVNGMTLTFGDIYPLEFTVTAYNGDTVLNTYTVTGITKTTAVAQLFSDVTLIRITFTKVNPLQRVHLNKISLAGDLDYEITYSDLKESPIATGIDRVNNVNIYMYQYEPGDTVETLQTVEVIAGKNTIVLNDDAHDFTAEYVDNDDATVTISESHSHYIILQCNREGTVKLSGIKYLKTTNIYTMALHETGSEKTLKNELISGREHAREIAAWLSEYFNNDVQYDFTYRGDPTIDCDDVIFLENKYVERNLMRVGSETLSTSTGINFSCTITGRRVSYMQKNKIVGLAVVGTAIVGTNKTS